MTWGAPGAPDPPIARGGAARHAVGACLLVFAAGALSLLSPCVLPLLPVALAGAVDRNRLGPLALAAGLAVSATGFGLAAQRTSLPAAAAVMAAHSAGAAMPLLILAYGSRRVLDQPRRSLSVSRVGKPVVGAVLMALGALTISGVDKALETALVARMPPWLVDLTTRF